MHRSVRRHLGWVAGLVTAFLCVGAFALSSARDEADRRWDAAVSDLGRTIRRGFLADDEEPKTSLLGLGASRWKHWLVSPQLRTASTGSRLNYSAGGGSPIDLLLDQKQVLLATSMRVTVRLNGRTPPDGWVDQVEATAEDGDMPLTIEP